MFPVFGFSPSKYPLSRSDLWRRLTDNIERKDKDEEADRPPVRLQLQDAGRLILQV